MSSLGATKGSTASAILSPVAMMTMFSITLFCSALLMFLIQPMFAKMALPRLGGSASVWSLALVFFQTLLLCGYGYAHLLMKGCTVRTGVLIHGAVMLTAMAALPVAIASGWDNPPEEGQAFWLLGLFAASVGLPFFAISANAPLLQSWFARSGHAQSHDPYFLYGASNAGSFTALVAYPFLIEPFLGLEPQSSIWSGGYALLVALVAMCGLLTGLASPADRREVGVESESQAPTWRQRLRWIALSFVPTGLLVGSTAYIATDVVSAPFMWVIPLALYLLTFVITFQRRPWISHDFVMARLGPVVAPLCMLALSPVTQIWLVPIQLFCVFALMMACHGELVRLRPAAGRLTEFYFLMSLGGVLGGAFASLLAPAIFDSVVEYPLLIIASFVLIGVIRKESRSKGWIIGQAALSIPVVLVMLWTTAGWDSDIKRYTALGWLLGLLVALLVLSKHPLAQAPLLLSVFLIYPSVSNLLPAIERSRSFYGVIAVHPIDHGRAYVMKHGTTEHGTQVRRDANGLRSTAPTEPQSYYYPRGPFGSAINHLHAKNGQFEEVAIVGLGTGSMACYALPGENWSFFEIDPEVVRIARNPDYFTFMSDCAPGARIVIGDGRLKLKQEPDRKYDLIVLDAFSSDSIPVHMITVEAVDVYLSKLKPNGVIMFHISNRFMELSRVVEAASRARGLVAYYNAVDFKFWQPDKTRFDLRAQVAVVARSASALGALTSDPAWHRQDAAELSPPWTDDYSNVPGEIWRKLTDGSSVPAR